MKRISNILSVAALLAPVIMIAGVAESEQGYGGGYGSSTSGNYGQSNPYGGSQQYGSGSGSVYNPPAYESQGGMPRENYGGNTYGSGSYYGGSSSNSNSYPSGGYDNPPQGGYGSYGQQNRGYSDSYNSQPVYRSEGGRPYSSRDYQPPVRSYGGDNYQPPVQQNQGGWRDSGYGGNYGQSGGGQNYGGSSSQGMGYSQPGMNPPVSGYGGQQQQFGQGSYNQPSYSSGGGYNPYEAQSDIPPDAGFFAKEPPRRPDEWPRGSMQSDERSRGSMQSGFTSGNTQSNSQSYGRMPDPGLNAPTTAPTNVSRPTIEESKPDGGASPPVTQGQMLPPVQPAVGSADQR